MRVLDLPLDTDLSGFSRILDAHAIRHRVFEERGRLVLEVADGAHAEPVREAWERFSRGEVSLSVPRPASVSSVGDLRAIGSRLFAGNPVTLIGLLLSVAGAMVVQFDRHLLWVPWFTFTDFVISGGRVVLEPAAASWSRGEFWRLCTPMFLHFGALHIIFNSLWYVEFGHHIERQHGRATMLALLLLIGVGANIAQYITAPAALFGGLSGVIYGLLGYMWSWNRFAGWNRLPLRPGIMVFMMIWLVLCMAGVVEGLGFGAVANAAHLGGLLIGLVLGGGAALMGVHRPVS